MNKNENKVTRKTTVFAGLGTIIGILGIEAIKAYNLGLPFAESIVKTLPEALGRAACVVLVFGIYYYLTKKEGK